MRLDSSNAKRNLFLGRVRIGVLLGARAVGWSFNARQILVDEDAGLHDSSGTSNPYSLFDGPRISVGGFKCHLAFSLLLARLGDFNGVGFSHRLFRFAATQTRELDWVVRFATAARSRWSVHCDSQRTAESSIVR